MLNRKKYPGGSLTKPNTFLLETVSCRLLTLERKPEIIVFFLILLKNFSFSLFFLLSSKTLKIFLILFLVHNCLLQNC